MTKMSVRTVKAVVMEIISKAETFEELLTLLGELEETLKNFCVFFETGEEFGEGYKENGWYVSILNLNTNKEIIFEVTEEIENLE